jgi:prepilin peptidase CpaA
MLSLSSPENSTPCNQCNRPQYRTQSNLTEIELAVFIVPWLIGVVVCDFAWRRVPNQWLLVGIAFATAALVWNDSPLAVTWQQALTGGLGAFAVLLCFYALGMMGAGDVKFVGVLGLWLGGPALVPIAIGAGLLAGGHALFWLARHRGPSLLKRRRCADDDIGTGVGTLTDASVSRVAMTIAIPYAGYLALVALLWVAAGTIPPSP